MLALLLPRLATAAPRLSSGQLIQVARCIAKYAVAAPAAAGKGTASDGASNVRPSQNSGSSSNSSSGDVMTGPAVPATVESRVSMAPIAAEVGARLVAQLASPPAGKCSSPADRQAAADAAVVCAATAEYTTQYLDRAESGGAATPSAPPPPLSAVQVVDLLMSFAEARQAGALASMDAALVDACLEACGRGMAQLSGAQCVRLVWALARLGIRPCDSWLDGLVAGLQRGVAACETRQLAKALCAFARMGYNPSPACMAVLNALLAARSGGFSELDHFHVEWAWRELNGGMHNWQDGGNIRSAVPVSSVRPASSEQDATAAGDD